MLNYHQIHSQKAQTKAAIFQHYLTLGSHQAPYKITNLISFSLITLHPQSRFVVDQHKIPSLHIPIVIPIQGRVRVNEEFYEPGKIVYNPKYIQEFDHKKCRFIYALIKGQNEHKHQRLFDEYHDNTPKQLTSNLTLTKFSLKQNATLEFNKRIFLWIQSGQIELSQTQQTYTKQQCLYTKYGSGEAKVTSNQATVFTLQFKQ